MQDPDAEFDDLIDITAEQLAHNAQRMDHLLTSLQEKLSRDYTHIPTFIGTCMVIGGFLHIYLRGEFIFSLTAMAWGSIILSLTLFVRTRIQKNLTTFGESLIKLDSERSNHARKLEVIQQLFEKGVPHGMSRHHLLILLGEYADQIEGPQDGPSPENN